MLFKNLSIYLVYSDLRYAYISNLLLWKDSYGVFGETAPHNTCILKHHKRAIFSWIGVIEKKYGMRKSVRFSSSCNL